MDKDLVDYFIDQTNDRFDKLDRKVDQLLGFKAKIIGGSVILSLLLTFSVQIIIYVIQK